MVERDKKYNLSISVQVSACTYVGLRIKQTSIRNKWSVCVHTKH